MSTIASLRILLGLDATDVSKGAGRVKGELKGVQVEANRSRDALKGVMAGFGLGAGLGAFNLASRAAQEFTEFIGDSITKASALNETLSKSAVIFGQDAAAVEAWGKTAATAFGQSTQQAIEARATVANLFKTMGLGQAEVLGMSGNIIELASDLASFNNIPVDVALEKLRSGLVGEALPLRTLGVLLTEATVTAKAMEMGLVGANGALSESAKVQARYALILEQTGTAQGDFARTSEGLANQQRTLDSNLSDLTAEIGGALMPVITGLVVSINTDLVPAIKSIGGAFGEVIGAVEEFNRQLQPFADLINWVEEHTSGAGAAVHDLGVDFLDTSVAEVRATIATKTLVETLRILDAARADGTISQDQYNEALGRAQAVYDGAVSGATDMAAAAITAGRATDDWVEEERRLAEIAIEAAGEVSSLNGVIGDLGALVPPVTAEVVELGAGLLAIGGAAAEATADVTDLMRALQGIDASAIPGIAERIAGRGDSDKDTANAQFVLDNNERNRQIAEDSRRQRASDAADARSVARSAAADAKRIAEEAARQAERDAADTKRAQQEAWRDAQDAADQYFDRVHDQNRRAIDDIRDRRNAELDAANAAIQGAVDAEREKLNAIRDREREQELRGAVTAAEAPEDLLQAQQDLQRFLQDQRVDFLQGRADAETALNEAARENANAAADMAIAAEALRDIAARERFDPRVRTNADGTVASVTTGDFLNDAPLVINLYIDGQQVTDVVDRRQYGRARSTASTGVSTGSTR